MKNLGVVYTEKIGIKDHSRSHERGLLVRAAV